MPDYTSYNRFSGFSNLSYNIISQLILNDEVLWRLLKHNTPDALSQTDLTQAQKAALVYKGQTDVESYKVFTTPFIDTAFDEQQTQLRVYTGRVFPDTYVTATVDFVLDIICHNKIAILSNAANRLDVAFEHIMQALNGRDVASLGKLYFNNTGGNGHSGSVSNFIKPNNFYIGYRVIMSVDYVGANDA